MRVARAAKHEVVQRRLAELLVRRVAQRVLDRIDGVAAHALEVVLVECGFQECVGEQLEERLEIVAVHAARQRRALDVDPHVVARRERVERREDLVERAGLGAPRRRASRRSGTRGLPCRAGRSASRRRIAARTRSWDRPGRQQHRAAASGWRGTASACRTRARLRCGAMRSGHAEPCTAPCGSWQIASRRPRCTSAGVMAA